MTVDEYIEAAPEPHRSTLIELRETLRSILPNAEETISYSMPAFKVKGKAIAGYAHFKSHCSYFPHSGSVLPRLETELTGYDWDKGTLRFPVDQPPPRELVAEIVRVRLEQLGM